MDLQKASEVDLKKATEMGIKEATEMELEEALEKIQRSSDDVPVVRECCVCGNGVDQQSKVIIGNRENIKFLITHTLCLECEKNERKKMKEDIKKREILK